MSRRVLLALLLFAAALVVYLFDYRYRVWGAGGDTTPAELLPLALMRNHDLVFDGLPQITRPLPWWFHDIRGHIISGYPIVPGFFNVPTYMIAEARGVPLDQFHRSELSMITASVVTALSVAFFFLAVSRLTARRSTATAATLLYAFGTAAFSVAARGIWQHGPSLLFLTIGIWLLAPPTTVVRAALAALPLGFAVWNRPPNALLVLPLAIYVLWRERRAFVPFIAVAAIPAALMGWYSLHYWGSITNLGQYSAGEWFRGRLFSGIAGLLFSPNRGLLVFTPLFVISIIMMFIVLRHPRREPFLAALAAGVVATVLLYAKWWSWWGGTCFGYRLLTECVPALTILLAVAWERFLAKSRAAQAACTLLFACSLYTNFLGGFYYPCGFNTEPDDVNGHPERLWDVRHGELVRCSTKLLSRLESHIQR